MDIANEEMQRLNNLINANMLPGESKGDAFKRLTSPIKTTVSKSNCSGVLCALTRKWEEKISELREDMHQAAAEMNAGKRAEILQVIETYHDCIDDLKEEMST